MSTISVIIPAYNAEKYIGEAIESALNQTRPAKEIVVVDDASTDRTVEIARSFGDRVKVLVNEVNSGPGHSRNAGVAASTGDYLAFLDADDKWLPEHLEDLAGLLDKWPEAGFAFSGVHAFGLWEAYWPPWPECIKAPKNIFLTIMRNRAIIPVAILVRRTGFTQVGGNNEMVEYSHGVRVQAEDYDFILRLALCCPGIASPSFTALHRRHGVQSDRARNEQVLQQFKYRVRLLRQLGLMEERHPLFDLAVDRMQRAWEERMRSAWLKRNTVRLRIFASWGRKQPQLKETCAYYRWRALCPAWLLRLWRIWARRSGR